MRLLISINYDLEENDENLFKKYLDLYNVEENSFWYVFLNF